jgi:hypothetical protein
MMIATLVSCGHCIVCLMIYGFWLPLWYLVAIVLSVLWFKDSDCPFGILWPLYCLSFDLGILIAPLVSCGHAIRNRISKKNRQHNVLKIPKGNQNLQIIGHTIQWPQDTKGQSESGHCIICPMIYRFWLPLWYLVVIVLSVLWFADSDCPFCIFWPLHCLSYDLRILIYNGHKIPKWQSESVDHRTDNTMATRYQRGNQNA